MIRVLDQHTRSAITSGCTITSLPQIVEELVANSIDAGARDITVKFCVRTFDVLVEDDGRGISQEDMEVICRANATSKISVKKDLENLKTFGYRGAALFCLSHVSILEVASRTENSDSAFKKVVSSGNTAYSGSSILPAQHGTSVHCRNIFWNRPVRRLSVTKNASCMRRCCVDIVQRIESFHFSHPHVTFTVTENSDTVFSTQNKVTNALRQYVKLQSTSGTLMSAVRTIVGSSIASGLKRVHEAAGDMCLSGYASPSLIHSPSGSSYQYVYINKRHLRDNTRLTRPINKLYRTRIRTELIQRRDTHNPDSLSMFTHDSGVIAFDNNKVMGPRGSVSYRPLYILFLELPFDAYDITFEPEKCLVEFVEWERVRDFVLGVIERFVGGAGVSDPLHGSGEGCVCVSSDEDVERHRSDSQGHSGLSRMDTSNIERDVSSQHYGSGSGVEDCAMSGGGCSDVSTVEAESEAETVTAVGVCEIDCCSLVSGRESCTVSEDCVSAKEESESIESGPDGYTESSPQHLSFDEKDFLFEDSGSESVSDSDCEKCSGCVETGVSSTGTRDTGVQHQAWKGMCADMREEENDVEEDIDDRVEMDETAMEKDTSIIGDEDTNGYSVIEEKESAVGLEGDDSIDKEVKAIANDDSHIEEEESDVEEEESCVDISGSVIDERKSVYVEKNNDLVEENKVTERKESIIERDARVTEEEDKDMNEEENVKGLEDSSTEKEESGLEAESINNDSDIVRETIARRSLLEVLKPYTVPSGKRRRVGLDVVRFLPRPVEDRTILDSFKEASGGGGPESIVEERSDFGGSLGQQETDTCLEISSNETSASNTAASGDECDTISFHKLIPDEADSHRDVILRDTCVLNSHRDIRRCPVDVQILKADLKTMRLVGQVDRKYILAVMKGSLLIAIDQHAAHERIRLEESLQSLLLETRREGIASVLCNVSLGVSPSHIRMLLTYVEAVQFWGFRWALTDSSASPARLCRLTQVPEWADSRARVHCFLETIRHVYDHRGSTIVCPPFLRNTLNTQACRGAIKFGKLLSHAQCSDILKQLSACHYPFQCAHGRPSMCPLAMLGTEVMDCE